MRNAFKTNFNIKSIKQEFMNILKVKDIQVNCYVEEAKASQISLKNSDFMMGNYARGKVCSTLSMQEERLETRIYEYLLKIQIS